ISCRSKPRRSKHCATVRRSAVRFIRTRATCGDSCCAWATAKSLAFRPLSSPASRGPNPSPNMRYTCREPGPLRRASSLAPMADREVPRISRVQQSGVARAERRTERAVYMLGTDRATHGWQPGSDGRLEYIIQLDDNAIEALEAGDEITSEIASEAGEVDRFVVRFGNAELPREPVMAASAADNKSPPPEEPPTARLAATQTGAAPPRSTEPSRYDAIGSSNPAPSRNATPPAANVPDPYAPAVPQYAPRQDSTLQGAPAQPYRAENPANSPQATYAPPPTAPNPGGTSSADPVPPPKPEVASATTVDPDHQSTSPPIVASLSARAEP